MKTPAKSYLNWLITCTTTILCFLLIEVVFRQFVRLDDDNNKWFRQRMLRPYHPPIQKVSQNIDAYLNANTLPLISYDSLLGWIPTPSYLDEAHLHDTVGRRIAYQIDPISNKQEELIIALFGDSYIYGAEVYSHETIAYHLQRLMSKRGIKVKVLNYGVGAYGMDQAYLRWKKVSNTIQPDIVLFGFQGENAARNTNMIRALYSKKEALPFFKPRFILQNGLQLINSPTPSPDSLRHYLKRLNKWSWVSKENYYHPEDYEPLFWRNSYFLALIEDVIIENRFSIHNNEKDFYDIKKEPAQLALDLISQFKSDVQSKGAQFYVVNIPRKLDINSLLNKEEAPYQTLFEQLKQNCSTINPSPEFLQLAQQDSIHTLFMPHQHYSSKGNKIVARKIAQKLLQNPN